MMSEKDKQEEHLVAFNALQKPAMGKVRLM